MGGGPAGLAAAIALKMRGADVLVADALKPPIDKACGEGIMPDGLAAAHSLGLDLNSAQGHPFRGIRFSDRDNAVEAAFPHGHGLGLRRKEIDLLEWQSFRWKENVVRIEPTRYFHPKSEDSLADLPVDPELMDIFRKYYAQAKGSFVIRSPRPPLPPQPHQYFRCDPIFDRLVVWLRKHGLNGNKPLHTLRKEYGSLLTRRHGIHAASRALRHADLRTTSEHYSDSTARVTPDVWRLLVNIYVQVTVTAEDPDSGQLLRDPRKVFALSEKEGLDLWQSRPEAAG